MLLTLTLSLLIGLLLGLLGGGGSILTVPMLVYLLHIEPKLAIVTSFVVIGSSSVMAMIPHAWRRSVCWKSGLLFGISGMIGAFGGGRLASQLSGELLMTLFGLLSLLIGIFMLRGRNRVSATTPPTSTQTLAVCPLRLPIFRVVFDGVIVGTVTGMVGVGGGFLIVPALTLLVGLPMQGAVGTSLLIIAMNALAGLSGYSQHVTLDWELIMVVAGGAIVGSGFGAVLSAYVKPELLRKMFAAMVIFIAGYVLFQNINEHVLEHLTPWLSDAKTWGKLLVTMLLTGLLGLIGYWIHRIDNSCQTADQTLGDQPAIQR